MQLVGTFTAEIAGKHDQKLFEIGVERRVDALLDAKLDPHHHGLRRDDHRGATLQVRDRDVGGGSPFFDGDIQ